MVEEPCESVPLKEAAKARLAAAVAAEAAAQVEEDVTNEEEKLDEQYAAIKIDDENKVIGKVLSQLTQTLGEKIHLTSCKLLS